MGLIGLISRRLRIPNPAPATKNPHVTGLEFLPQLGGSADFPMTFRALAPVGV